MKNVLVFVLLLITSHACAQRYSFEWIGHLGGNASRSFSVSDDGSIVAGAAWTPNGVVATRYTNGQLESLGHLATWVEDSVAYGISPDGTVFTGTSRSDLGREAFVWDGEMSPIGFLGRGNLMYSYGYDVSESGYVIGQSVDSGGGFHAFIWSYENGMVRLPHLPGQFSAAMSIVNDGEHIVGASSHNSFIYQAARWINRQGPYLLFSSPVDSMAYGISNSGNEIVGYAIFSGTEPSAFLWTESGGMTNLGALPGINSSEAMAISGDGQRVVGYIETDLGQEAFLWDAEHGMRSINDILRDACVNVDGVVFIARGLSSDGRVIVGTGVDSLGNVIGCKIKIPKNENTADINDDGEVNIDDLSLLLSSFGSFVGDTNYNADCDVNCNQSIDVSDLTSVFSAFGS